MEKFILGDFEVNTYIITAQNICFLIDPGYESKEIQEVLKKYTLKGILLTHGHLDHIDNIGKYNCPIYIHKSDLICLKDEKYSCYFMCGRNRDFKFENLDIKLLDNNDEITFLKENIKVIHTPGHTEGSVCYYYKDKLFTGDTLFQNGVGRTDLPTGDIKKLKKSVISIIEGFPDFVKVYPGHGNNTTIKNEKNNNSYYKMWKKL